MTGRLPSRGGRSRRPAGAGLRRLRSAAFLLSAALSICPSAPLTARPSGEGNPAFDITLRIDDRSAEETLRLLRGEYVDAARLASLRGNRIAAATTGLIAGDPARLEHSLDSLRSGMILRTDLFRLEEARDNAEEIARLLDGLRRRNIGRRVVATVEQILPGDIPVKAEVPLYVVALGHENADAYVRRIVWHGETPRFVGDGEGEPTIVINLAAGAARPVPPEELLSSILITVAHEVFHAAFGIYKDRSPAWRRYREAYGSPAGYLLDLVQNEGVAYYFSMEQQMGDRLPADWTARMQASFATLNRNLGRLISGSPTEREISEIVRSANLSGYWESYGSMAGMLMAREVDRRLGRPALVETLVSGPADLLRKYASLAKLDSSLPELDPDAMQYFGVE